MESLFSPAEAVRQGAAGALLLLVERPPSSPHAGPVWAALLLIGGLAAALSLAASGRPGVQQRAAEALALVPDAARQLPQVLADPEAVRIVTGLLTAVWALPGTLLLSS